MFAFRREPCYAKRPKTQGDLFLSGKNRFISYALTQLTLLGAAWITVSTSGQGG